LLVNEAALNRLSTHQYDPSKDYRQTNGDVSSEEKAKLMAHEVKEGYELVFFAVLCIAIRYLNKAPTQLMLGMYNIAL